jgi:hypothetical protein
LARVRENQTYRHIVRSALTERLFHFSPLILSGASYCDVGYSTKSPHPTPENPLGVDFPGITYAEPGEPNWVGHLVKKYSASPSVLVYDFARGGNRVDGVAHQFEDQFLPVLSTKPSWAPWTAEDTLFSA